MRYLVAAVIICSRHWDRLRQLICERGLGHLIHQPHDEFEEFAAELCGRRPQLAFEPMREARAVAIDWAMHASEADRDGCAICELVSNPTVRQFGLGVAAEAYWPAAIVDDVASAARSRGLTPRAA